MYTKLFAFLLAVLSCTVSFGQQNATDFTANDCNGDPHNLFTELNNGKTVVLAWVMPCIGCDTGSKRADSSVSALLQTFPDSVLLWIVDDGPPSDCNTLSSWKWGLQIQNGVTFGNYSNEIDQNNYGGFGMPHIVVIGPDKKIYFNEFNGTANGIYTAIQNAIMQVTLVPERKQDTKLIISPNPVNDAFTVISETAIQQVIIMSINGQVAKVVDIDGGLLRPIVEFNDIPGGIYTIVVKDVEGRSEVRRLVKVQ